MSANPTTDLILATVAATDAHLGPMPNADLVYREFAANISTSLPDVDPAVIGEVLLHAGDLYANMRTAMRGGHVDSQAAMIETGLAIGVLIGAGRKLYAGRTETSST